MHDPEQHPDAHPRYPHWRQVDREEWERTDGEVVFGALTADEATPMIERCDTMRPLRSPM